MVRQVILCDENCEGHGEAIFHVLERLGYRKLLALDLRKFQEVGLSYGADDETVWRFCQANGYLLLTGNRTTKDGHQSLELIVRRLVTPTTLPVLTIGNLQRVLSDGYYCERCAERLAEIVYDLVAHLGVMRLYLS